MRSAMLSYPGCGKHHHMQPYFLEACYLCQKPLGRNNDIFMYRGNTPFCSQECRQEQMEMDDAQEKKAWKTSSSSKKALRQAATEAAKKTGTVAVV
ncbi:hypothetical protein NMG60_11029258 [Bertholletia excelsa]